MGRVACVVQRYGDEVTGGAEAHARAICERLVDDLGWQVDVYTTTAKHYDTWQPYYAPGLDQVGPCRVYRYQVRQQRHICFRWFNRSWQRLARLGQRLGARHLTLWLEQIWLRWQGPWSPDLTDALQARQQDYDYVILFTYLYAPTQCTIARLSVPTVLVPTAHDEGPFYFLTTRRTLEAASRIFANTQTEADLICRVHPSVKDKVEVVGIGFDLPHAPATFASVASAVPAAIQTPFVVYCGRVGPSKNMALLYAGMQEFWRLHPEWDVQLVLCGALEVGHTPPTDERIQWLGYVDEQVKFALLFQAVCVVSPSELESLSLLVIEALAVKTPLILNRRCAVFREYAEQVDTIALFASPAEFAERLAAICQQGNGLAAALAKGQAWAKHRFSWQNILSAYKNVPKDHHLTKGV